MKPEDITKLQEKLEEQKAQLIENARATLASDMGINVEDLPDEMDLASAEYSHAMNFRLRGREKTLLKKIDLALDRIRNKEFGICDDCGDEIGSRRLEARPVTTLCIACKEEQERHEREFV
jgi:RNA polymerase-binding transcription factor